MLAVEDGIAVCSVYGDVDRATVPVFRHAAGALVGYRSSVIDLTHVAFMDSGGLSTLVWAARQARDGGASLAVAAHGNHLPRLLDTVGISSIVPVVSTVKDAVALVRPADGVEETDCHGSAMGSTTDRRALL